MDRAEIRRRAVAALRGLAVGDAMGAATEGYRPEDVTEVYEALLAELVEPVNLYPEFVDDRAQGAVGPVTRAALAAARVLTGEGEEAVDGDLVGWAVPLGIITPAERIATIHERAARLATGGALAAGAAVAAAVAMGVSGFMARDAVGQAVRVARAAGSPAVAEGIIAAAGAGQGSGGRQVGSVIGAEFPPGPEPEAATVFAFGVAFGTQSVRRAVPEAVNQGGAASLTAALAGALCGAFAPSSTVGAWADAVEEASDLNLALLADRLLAVREQAAA